MEFKKGIFKFNLVGKAGEAHIDKTVLTILRNLEEKKLFFQTIIILLFKPALINLFKQLKKFHF